MDAPQYIGLLVALRYVPDRANLGGQRYVWMLLLTRIAAAVASGERRLRVLGPWVTENVDELVALLEPPRRRLPGMFTL